MKKAIFISLFFILYNLSSFPQNNLSYNQNKPLFIFISPIGLACVSNMEFGAVRITKYDKTYEVSSTPQILYVNWLKDFNYNFIVPSNFVVRANGGKDEIVINIKKIILLESSILGETGQEIFKVEGSYIMTPKTIAGVYQSDQYLEIRLNSQ